MEPIVGIATFVRSLFAGRQIMRRVPDPKRELVALLNLQLATLENEVFGVVTDEERRDYWRRNDRIHKLHRQLTDLRAADMTSDKIHVESMHEKKNGFTRAA